MTLGNAKAGQCVVIREIRGGRGMLHRLAAMGLLPGREIRVVRNWGPLIVSLGNDRLVVGRGMAGRIFVEAVAGSDGKPSETPASPPPPNSHENKH